ncbi:hypothetical protein D3C73_755590 [compost metagenome]
MARLLKVLCIFQCRHCAGRCQAIDGVGVETVLYALESVDKLGASHREAHAQPRQRTRLGQRLYHQQVVVARDQSHRGFTAEVHIGFVHHHNRVWVGRHDTLNVGQAHGSARRRIGIREDDGACLPICARQVVINVDGKVRRQRYRFVLDAVQAAIDRIKAVGDVRKAKRLVVLEQRKKSVRQHFVGTVADEDLVGLHANRGRDGLAQLIGRRVRIQLECVVASCADGLEHLGRRPVRMLVGVQLDQVLKLGLLARNIRTERPDHGTPETAHGSAFLRVGVVRRLEFDA